MKTLTTKDYWDNLKRKSPQEYTKFEFSEILNEHLSTGNEGVALEIGCVPGVFLSYICKKFGYFPEGIDFDEKTVEITSKTLKDNGLNQFRIYKEDFTKWKTDKKYDLVCSFGFIEHFSNAKEIVDKHLELLNKGGKLVLEIPNFSGFNGFLHKLIDKPNLDQHNTNIMNLKFFEEIAERHNLKINYLGYYSSWHFQWGYGRKKTANYLQLGIYAILKIISKITIHIKIRNKLSNYIVFIAEKL